MLNFNFSEKGLGLVSPSYFVNDIWRKMSLMLYSNNCQNFITWLLLLLEILSNMCIAIVCWPGCDVMDFEINFIFVMKIFFLHDQKVMTKLKYLENENSFKGEIKSFFIILQGEIPSITKLATTAALSTKINEAKNKIPNITNLGTTIDFTPVENKIPIVRNLVKKIDYNTKMSEIKKKKKILIMIMINILLLRNSQSWHQQILLQD